MAKANSVKLVFVIIVMFFFLSFAIYSCKDDIVSNNNNNYNLITSISGKIDSLPSNARLIKDVAAIGFLQFKMDSILADSNNSMFLNLRTPPSQYLYDVDGFFARDTTSLTISDHDAKVNSLVVYASHDSSGDFAGEIIKDNHMTSMPHAADYFIIYPTYCDRKLRVTGRSASMFNNDTIIINCEINMVVGWNVVTYKIKKVNVNYIEYEIFDGELPGASWYFRSPEAGLTQRQVP